MSEEKTQEERLRELARRISEQFSATDEQFDFLQTIIISEGQRLELQENLNAECALNVNSQQHFEDIMSATDRNYNILLESERKQNDLLRKELDDLKEEKKKLDEAYRKLKEEQRRKKRDDDDEDGGPRRKNACLGVC